MHKNADILIKNAHIFTANHSNSIEEAVAVKDGKIIFVGSNSDGQAFEGSDTRIIDAGGNTVLPGLFDNHCHPCNYIYKIDGVQLNNCTTLDEVRTEVRQYAESNPKDPIIRGAGWVFSYFEEGKPHRSFLDDLVPDRPVVLSSGDFHNTWVNSKALEVAKILAETEDPEGGRIDRDENGEATGFFEEIPAMIFIEERVGAYTAEDFEKGLRHFFQDCLSVGITSVREAAVSDEPAYEAYIKMKNENHPVNILIDFKLDPKEGTDLTDILSDISARMVELGGGAYNIGGVKMFMDGVPEAMTAIYEEPYDNDPGNTVDAVWNIDEYKEICRLAHKKGYSIHVHTLGDRAVRYALEGMEYAEEKNGKRDARNIIAHIHLVSDRDIKRFANMDVIPALTPQWFERNDFSDDMGITYLGKERIEKSYPFKSFIDNGVTVTCGSDAPIILAEDILKVSFSPWTGIQQAVTRCTPGKDETNPENILNPDERISLLESIRSYTINSAYSWHMEKEKGSIETGKDADIIITDRDIFQTDISQVYKTGVTVTINGGKIVYENNQ